MWLLVVEAYGRMEDRAVVTSIRTVLMANLSFVEGCWHMLVTMSYRLGGHMAGEECVFKYYFRIGLQSSIG